MYEIILSEEFRRGLKKIVKKDNLLWKQVRKTLILLNRDINHRSLRLHKLSGTDFWSVSINNSFRLKIRIDDKYIFCLKFGKHEDVY